MEPDDYHSEQRKALELGQRRQLYSKLKPSFDPRDNLSPVDPEDLMDIVAPALALVGGVGMNADGRAEWMMAAGSALRHLPEDLLRRGVKAAQRFADHPSKIVPAIIAEAQPEYDRRVTHRQTTAEHNALFAALPAPGKARPTKAEVDQIMSEYGIPSSYGRAERRYLGPPRNPTTEDYIALGLEPQQARIGAEMVAHALLPAPKHFHDGQVGKHLPEQRGDEQAEAVGC